MDYLHLITKLIRAACDGRVEIVRQVRISPTKYLFNINVLEIVARIWKHYSFKMVYHRQEMPNGPEQLIVKRVAIWKGWIEEKNCHVI